MFCTEKFTHGDNIEITFTNINHQNKKVKILCKDNEVQDKNNSNTNYTSRAESILSIPVYTNLSMVYTGLDDNVSTHNYCHLPF